MSWFANHHKSSHFITIWEYEEPPQINLSGGHNLSEVNITPMGLRVGSLAPTSLYLDVPEKMGYLRI
jgi:hypothetical protein